MENKQINLLQIVRNIVDGKAETIDQKLINERAIKKAKQNGFSPTAMFNFESRALISTPITNETETQQFSKDSDVTKIMQNVVYYPNCVNNMKVPFVQYDGIEWGYPFTSNNTTIETQKLHGHVLGACIEISMSTLHGNDNFLAEFEKTIMKAMWQKLISTMFSTQQNRDDYDIPSGLFYNRECTTISDVETLAAIQYSVDKNSDNAIFLISPKAKQQLNKMHAQTPIFEGGKLLNSNIMFSSLVEDGYLCYVDLSKIVVTEFGVMGIDIDNATRKSDGKVRLIISGFFDFAIASDALLSTKIR